MSECLECLTRAKHVPALAGRLWCDKCDPGAKRFAPVRRSGYFLASDASEHGHPVLSKAARHMWTFLHETSGRNWDTHPPARTDGVSIYTEPDTGFEWIHVPEANVGHATVVEVEGRRVSEVNDPAKLVNGRAPWPFHEHTELLRAGLVPHDWLTSG